MLAPLSKYSRAQLTDWHAQYMREVINPRIVPAAVTLVREHQDRRRSLLPRHGDQRVHHPPIAEASASKR